MGKNNNENPIVFFVKESWLLLVSAVLFGSLLALTNAAWQPKIIQNEIDKFNRLAGGMLADAKTFEPLEQKASIDVGKGKPLEVEVKKGLDADGKLAGWAFVCVGSGFADKIKLVVAVDAKFEKLGGFGVLSSNETPGFGDKIKIPPKNKDGSVNKKSYQLQFIGAPTGILTLSKTGDASVVDDEIVAISGSTITSQAVVDTLNTYIEPIKKWLQEQGEI